MHTLLKLVFSIIASKIIVFILNFPLYNVTNGTSLSMLSGTTVNSLLNNNFLNKSLAT